MPIFRKTPMAMTKPERVDYSPAAAIRRIWDTAREREIAIQAITETPATRQEAKDTN